MKTITARRTPLVHAYLYLPGLNRASALLCLAKRTGIHPAEDMVSLAKRTKIFAVGDTVSLVTCLTCVRDTQAIYVQNFVCCGWEVRRWTE